MSAHCDRCAWTGSSTQVRDGGRCPECFDKVRYVRVELAEAGIKSVGTFNERAVKALRGSQGSDFLTSMIAQYVQCKPFSPKQQQAFINAVHSFRRQITDVDVNAYAETHAKGHDA